MVGRESIGEIRFLNEKKLMVITAKKTSKIDDFIKEVVKVCWKERYASESFPKILEVSTFEYVEVPEVAKLRPMWLRIRVQFHQGLSYTLLYRAYKARCEENHIG